MKATFTVECQIEIEDGHLVEGMKEVPQATRSLECYVYDKLTSYVIWEFWSRLNEEFKEAFPWISTVKVDITQVENPRG